MKLKKSTIVLIVLAVIFLGLSVVSTKYSVTRTITAIDEIGDMKLNDKKQDGAADAVKEAREAVDTYVPADEKWNIENYQDLLDLEATYSSDGGSGSSDDAGEAPPMC